MNVYEAYLAVKDNKIIKQSYGSITNYILQTTEYPIGNKSIVTVNLGDSAEADDRPNTIEDLPWRVLDEVCLRSFESSTIYEIIELGQILKEVQAEWDIYNNDEIEAD